MSYLEISEVNSVNKVGKSWRKERGKPPPPAVSVPLTRSETEAERFLVTEDQRSSQ